MRYAIEHLPAALAVSNPDISHCRTEGYVRGVHSYRQSIFKDRHESSGSQRRVIGRLPRVPAKRRSTTRFASSLLASRVSILGSSLFLQFS
jgi:hypothetical protein